MAIGARVKVRCHPELLAAKDFYKKVCDFEDGTIKAVAEYLDRYSSESESLEGGNAAYASRLKRLYNKNWIKPYLLLHLGHLSQDITPNIPTGEVWDSIKKNSDRRGSSHRTMAREMLINYMLDGRCGVLVDGPPTKDVAPNAQQAQARKERSWQVLYEASDILDWRYFSDPVRMGELAEVVLRDGVAKVGDKNHHQLRRFVRIEDAVIFQVLRSDSNTDDLKKFWSEEQDFTVIDEGPIELPVIPFTLFGRGPDDSFFGLIVDLNHAHMNRSSVRSNIVYNQGFQRVVFFGVEKEEIKRIGEWLATVVARPDAKVEAVPAGEPTAATEEIASIEAYITRAGKMEWNQLSDDTRQVQSADSKRMDTVGRRKLYDYACDLLEDTLSSIYQHHAMFEGAEPKDISVRIERDFGLEDEELSGLYEQTAFEWAGRLNVITVQQALLVKKIVSIRFVPPKGMSREEYVLKLTDDINNAKPVQQQGAGSFSLIERFRQDNTPGPAQ